MAPADSTSSPRDHAADANPELARKKQRLSEDPGASPTGSIIIEVDDPEDIGATMDNAIEIEDGLSIIQNYSDDFQELAAPDSPIQYVQKVFKNIQDNFYMEIRDFSALAHAIRSHCQNTQNEGSEWQQHYLDDQADFFNWLVILCKTILSTEDVLNLSGKPASEKLGNAVGWFLSGLEILCRRVIPGIPNTMKTALSRRDSAHISTRQHTIESLNYILLAADIIIDTKDDDIQDHNIKDHDAKDDELWPPTLRAVAKHVGPEQLTAFLQDLARDFSSEPIEVPLSAIIKLLGGAMRDIKDSWVVLQKALSLFEIAVTKGSQMRYAKAEVESVMETINTFILPAIREKHPRALPEKYHSNILNLGRRLLLRHIQLVDLGAAASTFQLHVSSSSDAVLSEAAGDASISDALQQVCGDSQVPLAPLIADSYFMQTAKSYLRSDIMDIRYIGLGAMDRRLVDLYHEYRHSPEGFEHPVVQHAIRFMRKNEIIPYIFGPESRAGLLNKSCDVVTFLAATQTYTNAETDIIWRACSTNVEADFVKASFEVLTRIKGFLDFGQLLHIARKYSTSDVTCFGADALEFLQHLLQNIESKSSEPTVASRRLEVALVSIEILKKANCSRPCATTNRLRQIVLTAISRLNGHPFSSSDRAQIYTICIPEIIERTAHATTSMEVLLTLFPPSRQSLEGQALLGLLSVDTAVEELCSFVQARKRTTASRFEIAAITLRLDCLGKLILLSSVTPQKLSQERLFEHMFGSEAFSNEARDLAWQRLSTIALDNGSCPVLKTLFQEYMRERVASLSSNFATVKLIEIIHSHLKLVRAEEFQGDTNQLLYHPLWNALVRFAVTSLEDVVNTAAVTALLDILFEQYEDDDVEAARAAAKCQNQFVQTHIDLLSSLKDSLVGQPDQANVRNFAMAMKILEQVFSRSQDHQSANKTPLEQDVVVLSDTADDTDQVTFTAQIYAIANEPKMIKVLASLSTRVSELLARLPSVTFAAENRIIAGGVEITEMADRTLSEAGIQQSGVVLLRPKFSCGVDLDKLLSPRGAVEQAILSRHSTIEAFLDESAHIAQSARTFLEHIRLPAASRYRVVSSPATANDLFPKDGPQRTLFSLFILRAHLTDYARLGLADGDFILRATKLLTAYVLDQTRAFEPFLMLSVLETLCIVLTEQPPNDEELEYFDDSDELASRLIGLLFDVKSLPVEGLACPSQPSMRNELAATVHRTIILAYQHSTAVWKAFTEHESVVELYGQLLLDDDTTFSARVAHALQNVLDDEAVPQEHVRFYWRALYPSLSKALGKSYVSESFFILVNKILNLLGSMDCEDTWISGLVEELCSDVWLYKHMESPPLLVSDRAMVGLLRLFSKAVSILKKKQKTSRLLAGLPSKLFRHFLFPPRNNETTRPLIRAETRTIVYNLVKATCSMPDDYDELVRLTRDAMKSTIREAAPFPGMSEWCRQACQASGLSNLGMTCYMNSLLQQLFGNLQFRKFVLDQTIIDTERQATLATLQSLFASMQDAVTPFTGTADLARVLSVQVGVQEDVHTFYTTLLSRLEESMPNAENRQALNSFFTGKSVTQIRGDCGHVSSREEPFTELSITVKNKAGLHESLAEFVQGEPLEGANKYMCMSCGSDDKGVLVNALRRTCLDNLPDGLTFCLKRFAFDNILDGENKVNDRFEFPAEIDMSPYKRSHLEDPAGECEPDLFELVGVIVHQGSLTYGHYWSYVRVPASQNVYRCPWMCLEDSKYSPVMGGIQEVQESCFGGLHWADGSERPESAYVLFYQRKNFVSEADDINCVARSLQIDQQILPKVRLQDAVAAQVHNINEWRTRIALFFQDQFYEFLRWLCDRYAMRSQLQRTAKTSSDEDNQQSEGLDVTGSGLLGSQIGELITDYVLQVFLSDPHYEERLDQLMKSIYAVIHQNPVIAIHAIRRFAQDDFGFRAIVRHDDSFVRSALLGFFFECLTITRQENSRYYDGTAVTLIDIHSTVLTNVVEHRPMVWREYLDFVAKVAAIGKRETRLVLDHGYLIWAFGVLYMYHDVKHKQLHLPLWKLFRNGWLDRSALYEFIHDVLDGYVDLSEMPMPNDPQPRMETARGWQLTMTEANGLAFNNPKADRASLGALIDIAVHNCSKRINNWREYGPGKLIGLLVGRKTSFMMSERICDFMSKQYDREDKELDPLLWMTLHILLQLPQVDGGMDRCEDLMHTLCKNIIQWPQRERKVLPFFREACKLAPIAVIRWYWIWADQFLLVANAATRQLTVDHLKQMIFDPTIMQHEIVEAKRIESTRVFVARCAETLRGAFSTRESRASYEHMIASFEHASGYLLALKEQIEQRQVHGSGIFERIMVQYEETKSWVAESVRLLDELQDWEPGTALPTRSANVRRSVEVDDSEELDTSDADAEEDDFSEVSAGEW